MLMIEVVKIRMAIDVYGDDKLLVVTVLVMVIMISI